VTSQPLIRAMDDSDPEAISAAFTAIGWDKPPALYQHYLAQQEEGRRLAWVAEWHGELAGYVTLLWTSAYSPFADRQVPEVADLAVLPRHRRQGIGNALLDRAESAASARSTVVGIGVGLYSDYGAATPITALRNGSMRGAGTFRTAGASCTATSRWNRAQSSASTTTPLSCLPGRSDEGPLLGAGTEHVACVRRLLHAHAATRAVIGLTRLRAEHNTRHDPSTRTQ